MRELIEHLQDTIEALKREIARNPKSDEYRKALNGIEARLAIAKQILARERQQHRSHHKTPTQLPCRPRGAMDRFRSD